MLISGRPLRGHVTSRRRAALLSAALVCLLLLALPALASAAGTITVNAGGDRIAANTGVGNYAGAPSSAVTFEYSSNGGGSWATLCTTVAGVCTSASLSNGTYLVREKSTSSPWNLIASEAFGSGPSSVQNTFAYQGTVTINNSNVTARPDYAKDSSNEGTDLFMLRRTNPALPSGCQINLKVLLVLDESTSITDKAAYVTAVKAFVNGLASNPITLQINRFSTTSSVVATTYDLSTAAGVTNALARVDAEYGGSFLGGSTNWDAALRDAAAATADTVVFVTDGNPNVINTGGGQDTTVDQRDIDFGIASANLVKAGGKKLYAIGAGSGVTALNLENISGPGDYFTADVANLSDALKAVVNQLCGSRLHIRKLTDDGTGYVNGGSGWQFTVGGVTSPVTIDNTVKSTDATGTADFKLDNIPADPGTTRTITVAEAQHSGYTLNTVQCFTDGYDGASAVSGLSVNGSTLTITNLQLQRNKDWYCTFRNDSKPALTISKTPDNQTINAGEDAEFTLTISNTGAGPAKAVTISDQLPAPGASAWTVSQQPSTGTCSVNGSNLLTCTGIGDLAQNATRTLKVRTTTSAAACGTYDNPLATVSATNATSATDAGKITCQKPNLTISKTPDAQTINAGDDAEFTITVGNSGPGVAKTVTVSDTLPAGPTWTVSQQPSTGTCSITSGVLSCTGIGDLASGQSRTIKVRTTTSAAQCATYDNTASAGATNHATVTDNGQITCQKAGVTLTKTAAATPINAGEDASFTITATNAGPGSANDVTVTDTLPSGYTWTIAPAVSGCSITSGVLTCDFGTIGAGSSKAVTITAPTSYSACTTIANTASATGGNTGAINDASASITCQKPALALDKKADAASVNAGEAIGFTITAKNNGPGVAKSVTLNDPLPAGVTWSISPAHPDCSITSGTLTCAFGNLNSGDTRSVHVTAQTSETACGTYDNTATLASTNHPDVTSGDTVQCLPPGVTLQKAALNVTVNAGDDLQFDITTSNVGPGVAKSVTLVDPLPAGVSWTIDPAADGCSITTGAGGAQTLDCAFGDMIAGATRVVTVKASTTYEACASYPNTATADATNAPAKESSATIECAKPALTFTKQADAATVDAGDGIGFTMTAKNDGPGVAKSVALSDPLPAGVTWTISPANPDCSITSGTLNCAFGDLAAGDTRTVHVTATTTFAACATYTNTGTLTASNHPNLTASDSVACRKPDVTFTKKADKATVNAGEQIGFTITAKNTGDGLAKTVKVTDTLPSGPAWTIDPADPACSITAGVLDCDFGNLAKDETASVHVVAGTSIQECATYDNTAKLTIANAPDQTASDTVACQASDVAFTKKADNATVDAGEQIGFTIKAVNNGDGTAKGVTFTDTLPAGPTWTIDPADPACSITAGVLTCDFGDLAKDDSAQVHVVADTSFQECSTYDNTARLTSDNAPDQTASDSVACRRPDVTFTKQADAATVDAGDAVGFTMTAKNNGDGLAKGVTLSDTLPAGPTWTIDPANPACSITGGVLTCDFGDLAKGDSAEVHVSAATSETECGTYDNTAKLTVANAPEQTSSDTVTCDKPALGFDKAALKVVVDAGDDMSFDLTTSNAGPGTAKGVTLSDPLPAGVTWLITDQPQGAPCAIANDTLTCSFGDLEAGDSVKVTITAKTSFEQCATYENTATADAVNAPAKSDTDTVTCRKPKITQTKTAADATVNAGEDARFTITTSNADEAGTGNAKGVVVKDDLPGNDGADWSIVSPASGCAITGSKGAQKLLCDPVDLAPGESFAVTVTSATSFQACGVWQNTATFSPAEPTAVPTVDGDGGAYPNGGNAGSGSSDQATVTCLAPATVRVVKVVQGQQSSDVKFDFTSDLTPNAGDQATSFSLSQADGAREYVVHPGRSYTITEADATLTKDAPFVSAECVPQAQEEAVRSSSREAPARSAVTGELAPGEVVTCTFTNKILTPKIAIEKTGPATAVAGELITYNLKVTNTGETPFVDGANGENGAVVVTDQLCQAPPKLVSKDGDTGDATTLSPGEFWSYQCQVATKAGDTLVDNTADVTGKDPAGKTATATSNAKTTLSQPSGGVSPVTPSGVTGRAKLSGTVGCASAKWAKATVGGSNIRTVTFYVNGRKVLTLSKPNVSGRYQLRYRVKTLRYGAYKVRAKVQFTSNASPRTKTLSLQFSRCKPRVIQPKFTG